MHTTVRIGNPGAQPPVLDCIRSTPNEVQIVYSSDRRLCSVAKGIVKGVARHYGETVRISEDACMLRGDPFCALQVTRVPANEAIAQSFSQNGDRTPKIRESGPRFGTSSQAPAELETGLYLQNTPLSGVSGPSSRTGAERFPFLKPPLQPDELGRLADYRVLQLMGQGGMGIVFRAEDTRLGRVVALKVMQPHLASDSKARERFMREARAMAALKNDHVITVYEVGGAGNLPFLAMEFLEGEALDSWQMKVGRLPLAQMVRIGKETAQGLAAAHARGLVHRDVKPSNLWLEAPTGRVKILDFGLARLNSEAGQVSQVGLIVGTPAFMAPEQARGEVVDYRADLFSLGCVLYWLCTGQLPFKGTDVLSTLTALATEQPEPPQAIAADVTPVLSDLVMELLHKDPDYRPASGQTAVNVLAAIEDSLLAVPGEIGRGQYLKA
jgi:serine/threonine protein kinase